MFKTPNRCIKNVEQMEDALVNDILYYDKLSEENQVNVSEVTNEELLLQILEHHEHVEDCVDHVGDSQNKLPNSRPNESYTDTSVRFADVTEEDTDKFIWDNVNKNTQFKTKSDVKIFQEWLESVGQQRKFESIDAKTMDALLARFYLSVRKKDGTEYEPDTITSIHNSIDIHFKDLKLRENHLKGWVKEITKMKADPLDKEEVQLLYEYNCLGAGNPKSLLNSVWLNNGVYFGMRGRQDHTNLLRGDIELKTTSDAKEYLEFTEKSTKTRNGAKVGDFRKVSPKIFAVPDDENCPIKIYKAYRSHRPLDMNCEDARFYLRPLDNPKLDIWYSRKVLGKNTLGSMMNNMATQAGLKGRNVNHSSRKTFATTLVQDGKPPTEIAQLWGLQKYTDY